MTDTSSCNSISGSDPAPAWVPDGGFVALILIIILMFWGMAFVCEEYSIPSITVFCKRNNIPDDIAGAIYIGTGLSLPVLFVSFVGLFISNTAIGVGTVIGGDLFNHLINIGLSIWVAPNHTLKVNSLVVTREIIFYFISSLLVIWAVHEDFGESLRNTFNREQWLSCLDIPWSASLVLVACYLFYVIIESYFDRLLVAFQRRLHIICPCFGIHTFYQPTAMVDMFPGQRDDMQRNSSDTEKPANSTRNVRLPSVGADDNDDNSSVSSISTYSQSYPTASNGNISMQQNIVRWKNNNSSNRPSITELKSGDKDDDAVVINFNSPAPSNLGKRPSATYQEVSQKSPGPLIKEPEFSSDIPLYSRANNTGLSTIPEHTSLNNFTLFIRNSNSFIDCLPFNHKWRKRYCILNDYGLFYQSTDDISLPSFAMKPEMKDNDVENNVQKLNRNSFTNSLSSKSDYSNIRYINLFQLENFFIENINKLEFSIKLKPNPDPLLCGQKTFFYFRAPNAHVFNLFLFKLEWFLLFIQQHQETELQSYSAQAIREITGNIHDDIPSSSDDGNPQTNEFDDINSFVDQHYYEGGDENKLMDETSLKNPIFEIPSYLPLKCLYYFTLPLKLVLFYTIPDVRYKKNHHRPIISTLVGFTWLAIFTYILVICLNYLAMYLGVNPIVMGFTVATWSAAYPALWSSLVVARNNFGDIAVCNALGSNVFNNFIGLGLPWLLYSLVYKKSYSGVQDQGVTYSILLLMMLLFAFYVLVAINNFVLKYWMAPLFLATYVGFTSYLIYFTVNL